MKKSLAAILFSWYFLLIGDGGKFGPDIFMMVGPFNDQVVCTDKAHWAKEKGAKSVTDCWEGSNQI
jgi:hypothetical protein